MFDFSTLITDRNQGDLDALEGLLSVPSSEWTPEQLAQFNQAAERGAYNASDLNRVGNAVNYVANRLRSAGYTVDVSPKITWTAEDIPTESDMTAYLADVATIRGILTVPDTVPTVPEDMALLTYQEANDIESILSMVDGMVTNMMNAWFYADEISCGEV